MLLTLFVWPKKLGHIIACVLKEREKIFLNNFIFILKLSSSSTRPTMMLVCNKLIIFLTFSIVLLAFYCDCSDNNNDNNHTDINIITQTIFNNHTSSSFSSSFSSFSSANITSFLYNITRNRVQLDNITEPIRRISEIPRDVMRRFISITFENNPLVALQKLIAKILADRFVEYEYEDLVKRMGLKTTTESSSINDSSTNLVITNKDLDKNNQFIINSTRFTTTTESLIDNHKIVTNLTESLDNQSEISSTDLNENLTTKEPQLNTNNQTLLTSSTVIVDDLDEDDKNLPVLSTSY